MQRRIFNNDKTCKIVAESLYFDGPIAEVVVYNSAFNRVESISGEQNDGMIDFSMPYDVYNMGGIKIGYSKGNLAKGIYIIRQGNKTRKITVG